MRRAGLTFAVVLAIGMLAAAPAAAAKKKGGGALNVTKAANLAIPDEAPPIDSGVDGVINSTIEAGKQFKGRKIRDVNVTLRTTGTTNKSGPPPFTGAIEALDLSFILRAPNGAHATLFFNLFPAFSGMAFAAFPSIGPLTLDDEAPLALGIGSPHDAQQLYVPYAGTARPQNPLAVMDNGPVRGTWTLTAMDVLNTGTSTLSSWSLDVTAGKPFVTK